MFLIRKINEEERRMLKTKSKQISDSPIDLLEKDKEREFFKQLLRLLNADKKRVNTRFSQVETLVSTLLGKQK